MKLLDRIFHLTEHGTTVRREVVGAFTSFFAIAYIIFVTPGYLSKVFRDVTGMTVMQYMMKEKTEHCQNLLKYSHYSFEEIAYYFGFCSQSHFGQVFKKWTGMTPRQYRETYGTEE